MAMKGPVVQVVGLKRASVWWKWGSYPVWRSSRSFRGECVRACAGAR